MTELKTLKDIPHRNKGFMQSVDDIQTFKDNLKAEAVKWVKHYKQAYEESDEEDIKLAYDWMTYFFNLTEDDLEEKE